MNLEAARQQYLLAWNDTAFTSQFDSFIEEGSALGYGVYREHVPTNTFRPGETIVLYVEPIGFGHQPISDTSQDGGNASTTLYLMNMTSDYVISDSNGTELQTIEDVPVGNLISHRQNLELFLTLTLRQDELFPLGDYLITYVIHDQISGQSFQIEKGITIADNATTGASALIQDDNSMQPAVPQQQQDEQEQESECDPSYPDVCIPSPPPDLDCDDVSARNFSVLSPDPHGLDGNDNDGIGCEN